MKILAATNNKGKLKEFYELLNPLGFTVISPSELNIDIEPEETGATFKENALIKALAYYAIAKIPCLADDSGLVTEALNGAPGVLSARYAEGSDSDRVNKLLFELNPHKNRNAKFVSVIALVFSEEDIFFAKGEAEGEIGFEPKGDGGFGYDPVFIPKGYTKTFSELSLDEKNKISHRGKALLNLKDILEKRAKDNEK